MDGNWKDWRKVRIVLFCRRTPIFIFFQTNVWFEEIYLIYYPHREYPWQGGSLPSLLQHKKGGAWYVRCWINYNLHSDLIVVGCNKHTNCYVSCLSEAWTKAEEKKEEIKMPILSDPQDRRWPYGHINRLFGRHPLWSGCFLTFTIA